MKTVRNMRKSTVLKFLGCGALVLLTADLQGQLIKQINFSAAEGYTNGPLWGQPAGAGSNTWTCVSNNEGNSWTNADGTPFIVHTVTNGAMYIWPDQNFGTNTTGTMYWAMPFPVQRTGPITVTWDWQFFATNVIPVDYDPTNNNYNADCGSSPPDLQGTDHGFTLADSANRPFSGNQAPDGSWYAVFNTLCTPNRIASETDARYNGSGEYGTCGGGGSWNNCTNSFGRPGPEFKDGKKLHLKMVAYVGDAASPTNNSFDVWAQRDGEDIWHTTVNDFYPNGPYPMRRCPGEYDSASGINCITMWLNGGTYSTHITVSNILILGPIPILSIERTGTDVKLTYSGTLLSADAPQGPYTDLAGPGNFMVQLTTLQLPAAGKEKFYRARN